jgi:hypothetical protein
MAFHDVELDIQPETGAFRVVPLKRPLPRDLALNGRFNAGDQLFLTVATLSRVEP